ncbi:MAG TPA: PIN domain-containing protein [Gaiellaceae bacterium]|nr:PIN domain-containing protein [Gaiellaceae bacterium]
MSSRSPRRCSSTSRPGPRRSTPGSPSARGARSDADASALVKLVRDEPESEALRAFVDDADLVSCELVLAEPPRAIRRAAADDPRLPLDALVVRAGELLEAVAVVALDRGLLALAGAARGAGAPRP